MGAAEEIYTNEEDTKFNKRLNEICNDSMETTGNIFARAIKELEDKKITVTDEILIKFIDVYQKEFEYQIDINRSLV